LDAQAVDWLLYLNAECGKLPISNLEENITEAIPRYIFLYMSSAPKTAALFKFLMRQLWYPAIDTGAGSQKRAHNLHRNREQILLVARAGWGADGGRDKTKVNVDEILLISSMMTKVEKSLGVACEKCVLQGGEGGPNCAWRDVCDAIKKVERKTADVPDLGLMSRLTQYKDILKARPRLSDQKICLEELDEILKTGIIPDLALKRVLDQQSFAATQSLLARRLVEPNTAGPSATLPTLPEPLLLLNEIFPKLTTPYDQTQAAIAKYSSLDLSETEERRSVLLQAMHEFLELDDKVKSPSNREHELARLLLHLAFGGESGSFDVIERSRQLRDGVAEVSKEPYLFVACSIIASLQLGRNVDTQRYASEAIKLSPEQAFPYHARGVNTFSWKRKPGQAAFCSMDTATCVTDEESALAILQQNNNTGEHGESRYLLGLVLNNLAFMQSFSNSGEFAQIFNLDKARQALDTLLQVFPRHGWRIKPGFFHTEAHLEYQLASSMPGERSKHLENARIAIESALKLRPQDKSYMSFRKYVEDAIRRPASQPLPSVVYRN
jgi:hypothetical protein